MQDSGAKIAQNQQTLMFCIGAQKAGITWLQAQLERRESVFIAIPKELHYWDYIRAPYHEKFKIIARSRMHVPGRGDPFLFRMSRFWHPELRQRIVLADRYAELYESMPYDHTAYKSYIGIGCSDARLVADITPSYALLSRETYSEMLACARDVRFVFIMRDPVARLWSGIQQQFRSRPDGPKLAEQDLVRRFESICNTPLDPNYLRSDYPRTISEIEAAVTASKIHYCFFETLLDPLNGKEEREKLGQFLDIPASWLDPTKKIHANENSFVLGDRHLDMARSAMHEIYSWLHGRFGHRIPWNWSL